MYSYTADERGPDAAAQPQSETDESSATARRFPDRSGTSKSSEIFSDFFISNLNLYLYSKQLTKQFKTQFLICLQSALQSGPTSSTSVTHPLTIPVPAVHEVHAASKVEHVPEDDSISVVVVDDDEDVVVIDEDDDGTCVVTVSDDDYPLDDDTDDDSTSDDDLPSSGVMPRAAVKIESGSVKLRQVRLPV